MVTAQYKVYYLLEISGQSYKLDGAIRTLAEKSVDEVLNSMATAIAGMLKNGETIKVRIGSVDAKNAKEVDIKDTIASLELKDI